MEIGLILLSLAVVLAAAVLAFTRPRPHVPAGPDPRLDDVIRGQGNISGQFQQTLDAQARLQTMLAERIEALDKRLGESLTDTARQSRMVDRFLDDLEVAGQ